MRNRKHKTKMMGLSLILALLLVFGSTFTMVFAQDFMKSMTWNGQNGSEFRTSECGGWHWILTPGGKATLTSGILTGEVTVTKQVYNENTGDYDDVDVDIPFEVSNTVHGSGNGAMHFYLDWDSNELSDTDLAGGTIKSATAHFDYNGNPKNQVLTISHLYCPEQPERDPRASLIINKELFDENDDLIEASTVEFEVLINIGDEEFWEGNISVDSGYSNNSMELGTYFIKENVDDDDFNVTYKMGNTELDVDEDGFIQVELTQDEQSVTIVIQNRPVVDEEPERESIELEIIKRIVQLNEEEEEVDIDDMDEFEFEVTLTEDEFESEGENDEMLLLEVPDTFAGLYTIHTGEGGSDGKTHFFVNFPNLTPFYMVEETEINEEDGFTLLRYEVRFYDEDDNQIGDTDTETDTSFALNMGKYETVPARVEITVFNLFTPEDEPEDPVDDPEDPVDDPEDPADDPDDDDPVTVPETTTPAGGGTPAVATTVVEPEIPLAAPDVEVEDPVIILDEPIPLAPPVLPQTGDSNPLNYSLAGLLLMAVGFIFRKRLVA